MIMLSIYLFASMKLEKGHKKYYLALVYEICWNIIWNGGLNKKLNTIQWKRICLVHLFCLEVIFTT